MPENLKPRFTRDDIETEIKEMLKTSKGVEVLKFNWSGPASTDPVEVVYRGALFDEIKTVISAQMATRSFDAVVTFKQHQIGEAKGVGL